MLRFLFLTPPLLRALISCRRCVRGMFLAFVGSLHNSHMIHFAFSRFDRSVYSSSHGCGLPQVSFLLCSKLWDGQHPSGFTFAMLLTMSKISFEDSYISPSKLIRTGMVNIQSGTSQPLSFTTLAIARNLGISASVNRVTAVPRRPARPVLPMRRMQSTQDFPLLVLSMVSCAEGF